MCNVTNLRQGGAVCRWRCHRRPNFRTYSHPAIAVFVRQPWLPRRSPPVTSFPTMQESIIQKSNKMTCHRAENGYSLTSLV
jgi:hypothetical protein